MIRVGGFQGPFVCPIGVSDSRDHVYGVVERYNCPYVAVGCGGEIFGFMCVDEV